jgi:hypothetical protein
VVRCSLSASARREERRSRSGVAQRRGHGVEGRPSADGTSVVWRFTSDGTRSNSSRFIPLPNAPRKTGRVQSVSGICGEGRKPGQEMRRTPHSTMLRATRVRDHPQQLRCVVVRQISHSLGISGGSVPPDLD